MYHPEYIFLENKKNWALPTKKNNYTTVQIWTLKSDESLLNRDNDMLERYGIQPSTLPRINTIHETNMHRIST